MICATFAPQVLGNVYFTTQSEKLSLKYTEKAYEKSRDISDLANHFKSSADEYLFNCERIYDVYKKYNVSHTSLIKEFKTLTGKTPVEYVATKRLENACKLLRNTTLSVEEISNCLDYTSVSHFIKKFKLLFNTTPLSYRKNGMD